MGVANAQRTLNLIRSITEFLSFPENSEVRSWRCEAFPSLLTTSAGRAHVQRAQRAFHGRNWVLCAQIIVRCVLFSAGPELY